MQVRPLRLLAAALLPLYALGWLAGMFVVVGLLMWAAVSEGYSSVRQLRR